jgi:predicted PurR-regulated permease PerM
LVLCSSMGIKTNRIVMAEKLNGDVALGASNRSVEFLIVAAAIVTALMVGRDFFIPIAIAVLLSFVLNPLAHALKRLHLGKVASVLITVFAAFSLIVSLGFVIARQVNELANDLPRYESTLRDKVRALRGLPVTSGVLEKATQTLGKLGDELELAATGQSVEKPSSLAIGAKSGSTRPIPVEIRLPTPRPFESFQRFLVTALSPLATSGIVILLVICILLQREDLRDRVIRLIGARDLERTTRAMDDAAGRLSQFYLAQTIANAFYGAALALGLFLIGVPNPILWGIVASVLRFVPTLGGLLAAAVPIALAATVDQGWTMVLATVALYALAEIVMGQIIEPRFRGRSTGLSPLAGILAMMFWTWAWGPIGLIVATPLTVLLVVLGKHVDRLDFLEVLLGAAPALTPAQIFYQRLLAGDPEEAASQAELQLADRTMLAYADEIALPGLRLAQADLQRGTVTAVRAATIKDSLDQLIEYLPEPEATDMPSPEGNIGDVAVGGADPIQPVEPTQPRPSVLIIGARTALDQAAGAVLARVLFEQGQAATVIATHEATVGRLQSSIEPIDRIAVSYLNSAGALSHARFLQRRIRRSRPNVPIILCVWDDVNLAPSVTTVAGGAPADQIAMTMSEAFGLLEASGRAIEAGHAPLQRSA